MLHIFAYVCNSTFVTSFWQDEQIMCVLFEGRISYLFDSLSTLSELILLSLISTIVSYRLKQWWLDNALFSSTVLPEVYVVLFSKFSFIFACLIADILKRSEMSLINVIVPVEDFVSLPLHLKSLLLSSWNTFWSSLWDNDCK